MKKLFALLLALTLCAAFMTPALAATTYEIRQKSSTDAARIMVIEDAPQRTNINYISLKHPITISLVDATPSGKGEVLAIDYTTSNTGRAVTQYILTCPVLQLTSAYWPHVTVDGTFNRELIVSGGTVETMRIDGGTVTFDGVTITGRIELRGEATVVNFAGCTFAEGAEVAASPTVLVLENGVPVQ